MSSTTSRPPRTPRGTPRSRGQSSGLGLSAQQPQRTEIRGSENNENEELGRSSIPIFSDQLVPLFTCFGSPPNNAKLQTQQSSFLGPSCHRNLPYDVETIPSSAIRRHGADPFMGFASSDNAAQHLIDATRDPLSDISTNVDLHPTMHDLDAYLALTRPAPQEDTNDGVDEESYQEMLNSFLNAYPPSPPPEDTVPQEASASEPQDSTDRTNTSEASSIHDGPEDKEDAINPVTDGDDSESDVLSPYWSLPATTPSTDLETASSGPSEPQGALSSSEEPVNAQAGSSKISDVEEAEEVPALEADAHDAQSQPSETRPPPIAVSQAKSSTENDTSSRKRRRSGSPSTRPNKRPASGLEVQLPGVATPAPAATPPPPHTPVDAFSAIMAFLESVASSGATAEGNHVRDASKKATTASAASDTVLEEVAAQMNAASASGQVGSGSYSADAISRNSANLRDIVNEVVGPIPQGSQPVSSSCIGKGERGAPETTTASPLGGTVIQLPATHPIAQPVPVQAAHHAANVVAPGTISMGEPATSTTPASNPILEIQSIRKGQKKGPAQKSAGTKSKGGRGAEPKKGRKKCAQPTPVPPSIEFAGSVHSWHLDNPDLAAAAPVNDVSQANIKTDRTQNGFLLYKNEMQRKDQRSSTECGKGWKELTKEEKARYTRMAEEEKLKEMKRQGEVLFAQSAGPLSGQNVQGEASTSPSPVHVPGPSTAPMVAIPVHDSQVWSGNAQQQHRPPMQQYPLPNHQATSNAFRDPYGGPPFSARHVPDPRVMVPGPSSGHPSAYGPAANMALHLLPYHQTNIPQPVYGLPMPPNQQLPYPVYYMHPPPTMNYPHSNNTNANAGASASATNGNDYSTPPLAPHGQGVGSYSFSLPINHQASTHPENTVFSHSAGHPPAVAGPSMPPVHNNSNSHQAPPSSDWYRTYAGNEGPDGNNGASYCHHPQ